MGGTEPGGIEIWLPLAVGAGAMLATITIHALAVSATVTFVRRERRLGHAGVSFVADTIIVTVAVHIVLVAHLFEIGVWAIIFVLCGEFPSFAVAYDHSAVNYTTLGYGNVIMSPSWRLLGPLEAANGMLLFGVSTAIIFTVIQRLLYARFADLRA
jgi:hypothetical protein